MDRTNIAAHAMSEEGAVIYVVTSDQEKAIRTGLGMSQMQGTHLHCICSLHQTWNVRDHVCGGSKFGAEAARLWARWMLRAEGPKTFRQGYQRMLEKYADDAPRIQYIHELFEDEMKAHFKREQMFRNGTFVDVCECLISATKTWVLGKGRQSTSLQMAVVRIVEGCREMMMKSYLKPTGPLTSATVKHTECRPVVQLFSHCIKVLTSWAVKHMFQMTDKMWMMYDLEAVTDDSGERTGATQVQRVPHPMYRCPSMSLTHAR